MSQSKKPLEKKWKGPTSDPTPMHPFQIYEREKKIPAPLAEVLLLRSGIGRYDKNELVTSRDGGPVPIEFEESEYKEYNFALQPEATQTARVAESVEKSSFRICPDLETSLVSGVKREVPEVVAKVIEGYALKKWPEGREIAMRVTIRMSTEPRHWVIFIDEKTNNPLTAAMGPYYSWGEAISMAIYRAQYFVDYTIPDEANRIDFPLTPHTADIIRRAMEGVGNSNEDLLGVRIERNPSKDEQLLYTASTFSLLNVEYFQPTYGGVTPDFGEATESLYNKLYDRLFGGQATVFLD